MGRKKILAIGMDTGSITMLLSAAQEAGGGEFELSEAADLGQAHALLCQGGFDLIAADAASVKGAGRLLSSVRRGGFSRQRVDAPFVFFNVTDGQREAWNAKLERFDNPLVGYQVGLVGRRDEAEYLAGILTLLSVLDERAMNLP